MFDLLGKLGDLGKLKNLTVAEALEKFPQASEVLQQFNLLELAQSDVAQNLSLEQFTKDNNINIQDIITAVTQLGK